MLVCIPNIWAINIYNKKKHEEPIHEIIAYSEKISHFLFSLPILNWLSTYYKKKVITTIAILSPIVFVIYHIVEQYCTNF